MTPLRLLKTAEVTYGLKLDRLVKGSDWLHLVFNDNEGKRFDLWFSFDENIGNRGFQLVSYSSRGYMVNNEFLWFWLALQRKNGDVIDLAFQASLEQVKELEQEIKRCLRNARRRETHKASPKAEAAVFYPPFLQAA